MEQPGIVMLRIEKVIEANHQWESEQEKMRKVHGAKRD